MSQSSGSKQLTVTKKSNVLDKGSRTKSAANNGNGSSDNSGGGGGGGGTGVSVSRGIILSQLRLRSNGHVPVGTRVEGRPGRDPEDERREHQDQG